MIAVQLSQDAPKPLVPYALFSLDVVLILDFRDGGLGHWSHWTSVIDRPGNRSTRYNQIGGKDE